MALVATINGVEVHSTKKRVTSVINTRVEFTDGSWCDVATGQVVNSGEGSISIGGAVSDTSSEIVTEGPHQYQASSLQLNQLVADVVVEPSSGSDMVVTITGPEDEVKAIQANVRGGTLVIEGDQDDAHGNMTIVSSSGRTSIRGGSIVVSGGSFGGRIIGAMTSIVGSSSGAVSPTTVTVRVPVGTPISLSGGTGITRIGDVVGSLTAHVTSSGDVVAGRMTDVNLHIQGSGDVRIAEVNGNAAVQIQGSGDVTIEEGNMSNLSVNIQGSGDVTIEGVAQRASLSVMGSGDIRVARVVEQPIKNVMGSGDIRVRSVG